MAKQLGRAMLIRIGDGGGPEVFANLCGLNSKTFTINNEEIDVTTPDCTTPGGVLWKESLGGAKSVSLSGDGFFEDSTAEALAHAQALAAVTLVNYEVFVPDFGTYTGAFRLTSFEFGGETEGGVTYSLALSSSGAVAFAAV